MLKKIEYLHTSICFFFKCYFVFDKYCRYVECIFVFVSVRTPVHTKKSQDLTHFYWRKSQLLIFCFAFVICLQFKLKKQFTIIFIHLYVMQCHIKMETL